MQKLVRLLAGVSVFAIVAVGTLATAGAVPFPEGQAAGLPFSFPWTVPSATPGVHPVDDYPTAECRTQPAKFDGKLLYKCAFQGIMSKAYILEDEAKREAWAKEWEHKHDSDNSLDTPEGADKEVLEMVLGLGERFNYYQNEQATKNANLRMKGSFGGIGLTLTIDGFKDGDKMPAKLLISDEHHVAAVDPMEGNPAEKAGILKGDLIIAVDKDPVNGKTLNEVVDKIKGPMSSQVTLTIKRADKVFDVTMTRAEVVIHVVSQHKYVADGVFYFRITQFGSQYFQKEVLDALEQGKDSKAVILDLRGNPGGLLPDADFLAQVLLDEGKYLVQRRRDGTKVDSVETYLLHDLVMQKSGTKIYGGRRAASVVKNEVPIIVLVDEGSASASEIVSGTLQANHRAIIVGKGTHGKGVGQTVMPLPFNRSEDIISFNFQPGGKNIDWVGVLPDVEATGDLKNVGDPTKDTQLQVAIEQAQKAIAAKEETAKRAATQLKAHQDDFKAEQDSIKKMQEEQDKQGKQAP